MDLKTRTYSVIFFALVSSVVSRKDVWNDVPCDEEYQPENCNLEKIGTRTLDDYDRCGPANMTLLARNYFLGASGRRITYRKNKDAYDKIEIVPKLLRDVSNNSMETTVLGQKIDFPIGVSPTAAHKLAHPDGELATVAGISSMKTIMVVSSDSNTLYEDIVAFNKNPSYHLWMQMYRHPNRTVIADLLKRAEKNGFEAIVLTTDLPLLSKLTCDARRVYKQPDGPRSVNMLHYGRQVHFGLSSSFEDITWMKSITKLPIVAKGILSGGDALRAIRAGASAILVSNHGGRQLDGTPATIEALPRVVKAVRNLYPEVEIYVDGGIRSGHDVYKAIGRGAKMVFVGRPILWGLSMAGSEGVKDVMSILRDEFKEAMLLAGASHPSDIEADTVLPNFL